MFGGEVSIQYRSPSKPWARASSPRNSSPAARPSLRSARRRLVSKRSRCSTLMPRCKPLIFPSRLVRSHHRPRIRRANTANDSLRDNASARTSRGARSSGPRQRSRSPALSVRHLISSGLLARTCGWVRSNLARMVVPLRPLPPVKTRCGSAIALTLQTRTFEGGCDPRAVVGDRNGVLPMRSWKTIDRHHGPLIGEHRDCRLTERGHGLYGQRHARF